MVDVLNPKCQFMFIIFSIKQRDRNMERRAWTATEDQVLKNLYEKVKVNKWSLIAKVMQEEYKLPARTGKQCRERYNNHLNPFFAKTDWTHEEQDLLFSLHNQLGNKWAIIATKLGGRTDNGVKNHFFAKLRKSMRRINRIIQKEFKRKIKEIKINVLYKVVEASEETFKKEPMCDSKTSQFARGLKNEILHFAHDRPEEAELEGFEEFISKINHFRKTYKRRPKQLRRIPNKKQVFADQIQPESIASPEIQDSQEKFDSEDQIIRVENALEVSFDPLKFTEKDGKRQLRSQFLKVIPSEIKEVSQNSAQQIFKNLLIDEEQLQPMLMPPPFLMKKQTYSEAMGDSIKNDNQFFDESRNNCQIPLLMLSHDLKKQMEDELFQH